MGNGPAWGAADALDAGAHEKLFASLGRNRRTTGAAPVVRYAVPTPRSLEDTRALEAANELALDVKAAAKRACAFADRAASRRR